MLKMRHVASPIPAQPIHRDTSSDCLESSPSSNISLVLSDAQINAAEDLDVLGELEWLEAICDRAESDEDTDPEGEQVDVEFQTSKLVISAAGEEAQIIPPTPEDRK